MGSFCFIKILCFVSKRIFSYHDLRRGMRHISKRPRGRNGMMMRIGHTCCQAG